MWWQHCTGRLGLSRPMLRNVGTSKNQLTHIMDNTTSQNSAQGDSRPVREETTTAQATAQPQRESGLLDSLGNAIRKGAEDARTAAEDAIPKVKSAAAGAVYWTAYGVSFAAVFQWSLAKGLAPECLKSGLRDGVTGRREAAEKWIQKLRQRKEKANDAACDEGVPSAEAVQPGTT